MTDITFTQPVLYKSRRIVCTALQENWANPESRDYSIVSVTSEEPIPSSNIHYVYFTTLVGNEEGIPADVIILLGEFVSSPEWRRFKDAADIALTEQAEEIEEDLSERQWEDRYAD